MLVIDEVLYLKMIFKIKDEKYLLSLSTRVENVYFTFLEMIDFDSSSSRQKSEYIMYYFIFVRIFTILYNKFETEI